MPGAEDKADPNAPTAHEGPHGTPQPSKHPGGRPGGPLALIGMTLSDRYKIERLLGEGGMGAVYQAEHTHMRKRMAIKVLHPEMSRLSEVVARFEREAMAAAHIDHPNVATATDFGKLDDGSFFLALEFIEGQSLRDVVAEGALPLGRALHVTRQIASALSRAHALGIVHRDLKPENVMLVERDGDPDFVKVLDFGIAKVPVGELAQSSTDPGAPVLTQAGMVYGTPEYMAPEQALGQPVDKTADLYALGIMAYEMLTGRRPFEEASKVKLLGMHVTAPVPPMATTAPLANVPPEVEQIVLRLLAKEATERTQDAKDLIDELQAVAPVLLAQGRLEASQVARLAPASSAAPNPPSPSLTPVPSAARLATPLSTQMQTKGGDDKVRTNGKIVAIGVVGAIVLLFVVVSSVAISLGKDRTGLKPPPSATGARSSPTATVSVPSTATSAAALTPEERVAEAQKLIDRGDYASAIDKLKSLDAEIEGRADVHEGLVKAYVATHRPADAMREVGLLLAAKPQAADDLKIRIAVRDTAIGQDKPAADVAFKLLEDNMGTTGLDDLFDIAYGVSGAQYPDAAKRAQKELTRPELRAKMTPALAVTVDVVQAGTSCNLRKHLERAATEGDGRTLAQLKSIKVGPKPTGFRRDPYACVRGDDLPKAVKALEARVGDKR